MLQGGCVPPFHLLLYRSKPKEITLNKNILNMMTIAHDLQAQGKEPKVTVLPSAIKRSRKMMLRGQKSAC